MQKISGFFSEIVQTADFQWIRCVPRSLRKVSALGAVLALSSCSSLKRESRSQPDPPAYRPNNPDKVEVKVSLKNKAVYVLEEGRPLLVAATCGGRAKTPTPLGTYRVFRKIPKKRSYTYGFHVRGNDIRPGKSSRTPAGARYVGYPMPYWVEFKAGYGFHEGYVWPEPRSHGCLRLHKNTAPKFFELVKNGTPIKIAYAWPEDRSLGRGIQRPTDYTDPDPPGSYLISNNVFKAPPKPIFAD